MRSIKVATHPFLAEMDSHFAHLGPGANHAPVAEHLRCEFAAEIETDALFPTVIHAEVEPDTAPLHRESARFLAFQ